MRNVKLPQCLSCINRYGNIYYLLTVWAAFSGRRHVCFGRFNKEHYKHVWQLKIQWRIILTAATCCKRWSIYIILLVSSSVLLGAAWSSFWQYHYSQWCCSIPWRSDVAPCLFFAFISFDCPLLFSVSDFLPCFIYNLPHTLFLKFHFSILFWQDMLS